VDTSLDRRTLLKLSALVVMASCSAPVPSQGARRQSTGKPVGSVVFDQVAIGGGGYLTGLDVADDGTVVYRCDTFGAGILTPGATAWRQLMLAGITFPADQVEQYDGNAGGNNSVGTYDVAICAENSDVIYLVCMGYVWKSTDQGRSFQRLKPRLAPGHGANNPDRYARRRLAVHPSNGDVAALGTIQGLRFTVDGGATWLVNQSLPAPTTPVGGMGVCFDRDDPNRLYVFSGGHGIFRSTSGPAGQFSRINASPIEQADMQVQRGTGRLFVCGNSQGNDADLRIWDGSSWHSPGIACKSLAISNHDRGRIFAVSAGGNIRASTDGGRTFSDYADKVRRSNKEMPWQEWTHEEFMSNGGTVHHPSQDKILFAQGIGYWECSNPPTDGSAPTWEGKSVGIENLVGVQGIVDPKGRLHIAVHDRSSFYFERDETDRYPSTHGPAPRSAEGGAIHHSNQIDYASDNPDFLVMASNQHGYYSENGGKAWKRMADRPPPLRSEPARAMCGNMVVGASSEAILWLPANHVRPYYSLDRGQSWMACDLGAVANEFLEAETRDHQGVIGGYHAYFVSTQRVIADKLKPGTFYIYLVGDNSGSSGDKATKGIWRSVDNCRTWTRIRPELITSWVLDFWNGKLKQVPGQPNHFWWTAGPVGTAGDPPSDNRLWFSTDGCSTWKEIVGGPTECSSFTFGRAATSHGYPVIYAASENRGIYRCQDFDPARPQRASWTLVDRFPNGFFDSINDLAGDMDVYGLFYMIFGGVGALRARNLEVTQAA
jgi:hypothetical protein